jgi:hypothetical protein
MSKLKEYLRVHARADIKAKDAIRVRSADIQKPQDMVLRPDNALISALRY